MLIFDASEVNVFRIFGISFILDEFCIEEKVEINWFFSLNFIIVSVEGGKVDVNEVIIKAGSILADVSVISIVVDVSNFGLGEVEVEMDTILFSVVSIISSDGVDIILEEVVKLIDAVVE